MSNETPARYNPQLHSEYKSTYRWHEFKPNSGDIVVVRKPPQPKLDDFLTFSRKKKHPDVAYKSHEFFDASLAPPFPTRGQLVASGDHTDGGSRARSTRRMLDGSGASVASQRRARSEGPVSRRVRSTREDDLRPAAPYAAKSVLSVAINHSSSHGPGFARRQAPPGTKAQDGSQMTSSMPVPGTAMEENLRQKISDDSRRPQISESLSMSQIQHVEQPGPHGTHGAGNLDLGASEPQLSSVSNEDASSREPRRGRSLRKECRSEYKVKFRPFSNYEYVDGRFIPSPGANSSNDEAKTSSASVSNLKPGGHPWYNEVVELRKQANEFKCRGWGTDMASPRMNELYHKQLDPLELAKRRESLQALSLAVNTPRSGSDIGDGRHPHPSTGPSSARSSRMSRPGTAPPTAYIQPRGKRSESAHPKPGSDASAATIPRTKKSNRSISTQRPGSARPRSPMKRPVPPNLSRPSTATSTHNGPSPAPDTNRSDVPAGWKVHKEKPLSSTSMKRQRPTTLNTASTPRPSTQPSSSVPQRKQRPATAGSGAAPSLRAVSSTPRRRDKSASDEAVNQQHPRIDEDPIDPNVTDRRHLRAKNDTGSSGSLAHHGPSAGKRAGPGGSVPEVGHSAPDIARRPFSRSSSARTGPSRDHSRPPSAIENHMDYFREPVVKSPPEPTRVKSPEGSVRSPDPINWTVPLDTGKTFSVTQSIKDGESARGSPLSDHSSHFDSVSGTAINLGSGGGSLSSWSGKNEPHHGGLHHRNHHHHPPKISSLAKEARDLQPGLTKDSTMTKPALSSSAQTSRDGIDENSNSHAGEGGPVLKDLPAGDPMLASVYQPASALAEADEDAQDNDPQLNGNGAVEKHEEEEAKEKDTVKDIPSGVKPVPGTSLRCLEDPSFAFDSTPKVIPPPPAPTGPKKPAYRVLEDPMMMSMYEPASSSEAKTAHPAGAKAHEVLEGARETFDKFWGASPQHTKDGTDPK